MALPSQTRWSGTPASPIRDLRPSPSAFTLIEVLVGLAVLSVLLTILLMIVSGTSKVVQDGQAAASSRQRARIALEQMTSDWDRAVFSRGGAVQKPLRMVRNPDWLSPDVLNRDAIFWVVSEPSGGLAGIGYFLKWVNGRYYLFRYQVEFDSAAIDAQRTDPASWLTQDRLNALYSATTVTGLQGVLAEDVIGLWVHLLDKNAVPMVGSEGGAMYDLRDDEAPELVEIELVLLDQATAQRITSESEIRSLQGASNAEAMVTSLPDKLKGGSRIVRMRAWIGNKWTD